MAASAVGSAGSFRQVGKEKIFSWDEESGLHVTVSCSIVHLLWIASFNFKSVPANASDLTGRHRPVVRTCQGFSNLIIGGQHSACLGQS